MRATGLAFNSAAQMDVIHVLICVLCGPLRSLRFIFYGSGPPDEPGDDVSWIIRSDNCWVSPNKEIDLHPPLPTPVTARPADRCGTRNYRGVSRFNDSGCQAIADPAEMNRDHNKSNGRFRAGGA
jgi:hypothetical protein